MRTRRGWDSNPRSTVEWTPHFECGAFDHSATSPKENFEFRVSIFELQWNTFLII